MVSQFVNNTSKFNFTVRNLSTLAYAQGFTLWHYRAVDHTLDVVCTPGYFNEAYDMLSNGDMIMISATDGGALVVVSHNKSNVYLNSLN